MPCNEHSHNHGLATARGHLKSNTIKKRIGILIGLAQFILNPGVPILLRRFRYVNKGLQCLYLAKEQSWFPLGSLPIFEQA